MKLKFFHHYKFNLKYTYIMLKLITYEIFNSVLSIFYSVNINSQIDNIAERLGYNKDAKLLIIHADDIGIAHSLILHHLMLIKIMV